MYNFKEINSLNELKEVCFYIKAINESKVDVSNYNNIGLVKDFLKQEYNLEISVSKLYLFAQKILFIYNKNKFPEIETIDDIINEYLQNTKKELLSARKEVEFAELELTDPKFKVGKNKFVSTTDLSTDIALKRKLYTKQTNQLLLWACGLGVFLVSLIYCIIGIGYPSLLGLYVSKTQEILLVLCGVVVAISLIYLLLYLINYKKLRNLKFTIDNYYRYEFAIKNDILAYNLSKQKYFAVKNRFAINGIEMSDEVLRDFLKNSDILDIKYFNTRINAKEMGRVLNLGGAKTIKLGQVISRREQDIAWLKSKISGMEKLKINQELAYRMNLLADVVKSYSNKLITSALNEFYCRELAVSLRQEKIDGAESKIELSKNYISMSEKINSFEREYLAEGVKLLPKSHKPALVTAEERQSFKDSLSAVLSRIEKADSLGLLTSGQSETCKNIQKELSSGVVQGRQVDGISTRYELTKLYVNLFDELSSYDVLN